MEELHSWNQRVDDGLLNGEKFRRSTSNGISSGNDPAAGILRLHSFHGTSRYELCNEPISIVDHSRDFHPSQTHVDSFFKDPPVLRNTRGKKKNTNKSMEKEEHSNNAEKPGRQTYTRRMFSDPSDNSESRKEVPFRRCTSHMETKSSCASWNAKEEELKSKMEELLLVQGESLMQEMKDAMKQRTKSSSPEGKQRGSLFPTTISDDLFEEDGGFSDSNTIFKYEKSKSEMLGSWKSNSNPQGHMGTEFDDDDEEFFKGGFEFKIPTRKHSDYEPHGFQSYNQNNDSTLLRKNNLCSNNSLYDDLDDDFFSLKSWREKKKTKEDIGFKDQNDFAEDLFQFKSKNRNNDNDEKFTRVFETDSQRGCSEEEGGNLYSFGGVQQKKSFSSQRSKDDSKRLRPEENLPNHFDSANCKPTLSRSSHVPASSIFTEFEDIPEEGQFISGRGGMATRGKDRCTDTASASGIHKKMSSASLSRSSSVDGYHVDKEDFKDELFSGLNEKEGKFQRRSKGTTNGLHRSMSADTTRGFGRGSSVLGAAFDDSFFSSESGHKDTFQRGCEEVGAAANEFHRKMSLDGARTPRRSSSLYDAAFDDRDFKETYFRNDGRHKEKHQRGMSRESKWDTKDPSKRGGFSDTSTTDDFHHTFDKDKFSDSLSSCREQMRQQSQERKEQRSSSEGRRIFHSFSRGEDPEECESHFFARDGKRKRLQNEISQVQQHLAQITMKELGKKQKNSSTDESKRKQITNGERDSPTRLIPNFQEERLNLTGLLRQLLCEKQEREDQIRKKLNELQTAPKAITYEAQDDNWTDPRYDAKIDGLDGIVKAVLVCAAAQEFIPVFAKRGITKEVLFQLTKSDLEDMGITDPEIQKKLFDEIDDYHVKQKRAKMKTEELEQCLKEDDASHLHFDDSCCKKLETEEGESHAGKERNKTDSCEMPMTPVPKDFQPEIPVHISAECVVCLERQSNLLFLNCGHVCCCYECAGAINLCPLCRAEIVSKLIMNAFPWTKP